MTEYQQIISNLGFPIFACIALFWLIKTTLKEVKVALEQNNRLIEKLTVLIGKNHDV